MRERTRLTDPAPAPIPADVADIRARPSHAPEGDLIEVDGKVRNIAAMERWAWLGNLDEPGNPTIWRSNAP